MEKVDIDIHYNKLLAWLVDRRWVDKDYFTHEKAARKLVQTAWDLLPDEFKPKDGGLDGLHYYAMVDVLAALKDDAVHGKKNLIGQFTSPPTKAWAAAVAAFGKDRLYLADYAKRITHNVNFEVAAAKKTITRANKKLKDMMAKETEYKQTASAHAHKFEQECADLGVEADDATNLTAKIATVPAQLTTVFEALVTNMQAGPFSDAVKVYKAFMKLTLPTSNPIPVLSFLVDRGNLAVHTYNTGEDVEIDNGDATQGATTGFSSEGPQIDFGDLDISGVDDGPPPEIDFGSWDVVEPTGIDFGDDNGNNEPISIDFGDDDVSGDNGQPPLEIDFGDGESGNTVDLSSLGIITEGSGVTEVEVVRESVLHNTDTRNLVINELSELAAFFERRAEEYSKEQNIASINMFSHADSIIQNQNGSTTKAHVAAVDAVLAELMQPHTQKLLLIRMSPRYVQRVADGLKHKLDLVERANANLRGLGTQRIVCQQQIQEANEQLTQLRGYIATMKKKVEEDISKLYEGQEAHLVGEVNTV